MKSANEIALEAKCQTLEEKVKSLEEYRGSVSVGVAMLLVSTITEDGAMAKMALDKLAAATKKVTIEAMKEQSP